MSDEYNDERVVADITVRYEVRLDDAGIHSLNEFVGDKWQRFTSITAYEFGDLAYTLGGALLQILGFATLDETGEYIPRPESEWPK